MKPSPMRPPLTPRTRKTSNTSNINLHTPNTIPKSKNGETARDIAVERKQPAVVKLLDDFQKNKPSYVPSPASASASSSSSSTSATSSLSPVTTTITADSGKVTEEKLRKENAAARQEKERAESEAAVAREEMEKLRRHHQEELEKSKPRSQTSNPSHNGKAVGEWSVEDAQTWVSSLGPALAKYSQLFVENGVDGESLLAFDKGELTALGVNAAHAAMIVQKLKSRVQPSSPPTSPPTSTSPPVLPTIQDNVYEPVDTIMGTGDNLDLSKLVINKGIRLGAGNFGEVYQGSIGHQLVAVKMIKPAIAGVNGDKESKESKEVREKADKELEKEIKTWKKVPQHENVARLLGEVDRDGCKCIVMHLYPGGSLKEELDLGRTRGFSLKKKKSLSILLGIANGLKHLHQHQIVHRDLAARNILFENNARDIAVITDFGLSRDIGADRGEQAQGQGKEYYAMTGGGTLAIAWLPPETLIHRKSTVKSDVWSFGVLVWEVITQGLTPLSQLDLYQISGQAATGELGNTLLKALDQVEDADQDLVKLVEMCLIVDPVKRPSMVEVANAVNTLYHQTLQRQAHSSIKSEEEEHHSVPVQKRSTAGGANDNAGARQLAAAVMAVPGPTQPQPRKSSGAAQPTAQSQQQQPAQPSAARPSTATAQPPAAQLAPTAQKVPAASPAQPAKPKGPAGADLNDPHSVHLMVSNDVLEAEKQAAIAKIAQLKAQKAEEDELFEWEDRKSSIELQLQILEGKVSECQLSIKDYLEQVKVAMQRDKGLAVQLSQAGRKPDAIQVLRRVKLMEEEIRAAQPFDAVSPKQ